MSAVIRIGWTVALLASTTSAQEERLPAGVTAKAVTFYSEHVECYGRIFYPKGFSADSKTPGVVLASGWTGTTAATEPYAAQFAARGLVAMAIDYRGWGKSGGFVRLAEPVKTDDRLRFMPATAKVRIKRTRLLPKAQIEDVRNAISYLQGEPGVDRDRIGLWGTHYAGGHVISIAAIDSRVKVGVCHAPDIPGKDVPVKAFVLEGALLREAIQRARTGEAGSFKTGVDGRVVTVDTETRQATAEYLPFQSIAVIPEGLPILFITAGNDKLVENQNNAVPAARALEAKGNAVKVIEIAGVAHYELHQGDAFRTGARASADWFLEHLLAK